MKTGVSGERVAVILGSFVFWSCLSMAQSDEKVIDWAAPPYWTGPTIALPMTSVKEPEARLSPEAVESRADRPAGLHGVSPPAGWPTLGATGSRGSTARPRSRQQVAASPSSAPAAFRPRPRRSFNFSAVNVPGAGFLVAYPAGGAFPASATMTYNQNTPNLSNAAVVPLGTAGAMHGRRWSR